MKFIPVALLPITICGCVFTAEKIPALSNPPAPFEATRVEQSIPELTETALMRTHATTGKTEKQYAFICGDKTFYAEQGGQAAIFKLESNNLPLVALSYWGSTKAGWGHPFNSSEPELKLDQQEKSITATRKFESLSKDDSTFTEKMKLLDDGILELSYSCELPKEGKLTDSGLFINLSPYSRFAGEKIRIGDKLLSFSSPDSPLGEKILLEGSFSGKIVLFPDHPEKSVALEIPEKCQMYIKELRKEADKDNPNKFLVQMRLWPKTKEGTLKVRFDIRNSSSEALKNSDTFANINFWRNDRLHIPDFKASINLLQNPSFESDLHYYRDFGWGEWPGEGRELYSIDDTVAFAGKRSLRIRTWKDFKSPSFLSTFTIPTIQGKTYTFSFYAKANSDNTYVSARCVSGEWMKFPNLPNFKLTREWKRYSGSFTAPNAAAIVMLNATNGTDETSTAWIDALQLEEGAQASAYADEAISSALICSKPYNFLSPHDPVNSKIRIHTVANAKGKLSVEVEDFLYAKPFTGTFDFTADPQGEALVAIPLDGKLGQGVFIVKTKVDLENGVSKTDFHRMSIMDTVQGKCPNKEIFATCMDMSAPSSICAARLAALGFGSTNYQSKELCNELLLKNGMPNIGGSGVVGYGPGDYSHCSVKGRKELCKRIETEPYSDNLRDELEKTSQEMALAYPWIRTWFLQAESGPSKIGCLAKNDNEGFAKLINACRAGVLKADASLKFIFEGGPCNMYPDGGIAQYDAWLSAAEKIDAKIRYDAFAIHPYRPVPENPDLDADADIFIKMLERHGYSKEPIYWNEGIYNCPWHIPEWGLDVQKGCSTDHWRAGTPSYHMGWAERISAAYYARSWLVALKYSERIRQFNGWSQGFIFFDAELGHFALAKIPNTLCHLLGDAKFKKDIRFAVNCRAYVFEDAQGRPVAALWSHITDVDRGLEQSPVAKIRFDGTSPELFDLMENKVEAKTSDDGAALVPVTPFPTFIRGKAGSLESLCKALSAASVSGSKDFPLVVDMKPKSRTSAELSFTNRISRKFEGTANVADNKIDLSIPESGSANCQINLPEPIPFDKIALISLPLELSENRASSVAKDFSLHAFAIHKANGWDDIPSIRLTNRKVYTSGGGTAAKPVEVSAGYKGDFEAEYKMRWNDEKLFLQVKVVDDKAFFPKGENVGGDWFYDSLQIYIDTYGDNASRNSKCIFDFNDYSYTVSKDAITGTSRVYRQAAPEQQIAGGLSAPKPNCIAPEVEAEVTLTQDGYIYELAFPLKAIVPMKLKEGYFIRFGLFANDNDGEGRKGGLVNTDTPGSEPFSNPEQWPGVILSN